MTGLVLFAALMADDGVRQAWLDQLQEADRLERQNRQREAESAYDVARRQAAGLGPSKLPLGITLNRIGHHYQRLGRLRDARRAYSDALLIVEKELGAASHDSVKQVVDLTSVYFELDQVSKAEALVRRYLRVGELESGDRAILQAELASVLAAKRDFENAEPLYRQALSFFERDASQESRERTIIAHSNLSTAHMLMGRVAEGRAYSDQAMKLLETLGNAPPILAAKTIMNAATISAQTGTPQETEVLFRSAISSVEGMLGTDHFLLGYALSAYADFLGKQRRGKEARNMRRRADAILRSFNKENMVGYAVDVSAFR